MSPHPRSLSSMVAARHAVASLLEGGVEHVIICPGSRSAPLAYALAEAEARGEVTLHVRIDERDAGFTALGLGLATGLPAAIVTTSGTAVGELLPAVMEANHAGIPLLVLSADRPEELHGTGANQTTRQLGLFSSHVRHCADIEAGIDPCREVEAGVLICRGLDAAGVPVGAHAACPRPGVPGPVQLNIGFRDPLVPGPGDSLATATAGCRVSCNEASSDTPEAVAANPGELAESRTVVVAGHGAGLAAERFAREHGLPLLAEPSSNARFGPTAIAPYRLLIDFFSERIERVVVFGRPTLSRPVARLLNRPGLPAALYIPTPVAWFEPGRRAEVVITEASELSLFARRGPRGWLDQWQRAGQNAARAIGTVLEDHEGLTGPELAREVWDAAKGPLVIGSSNAIRDADLCAVPGAMPFGPVYANRGLAGIDGTLATATGVALAGTGGRTTVLVGDVTFLHDVGGLLLGAGEPEPELDIVVLNDAGGAIFSTLEHGGVAAAGRYGHTVQRLFGTPQNVDLSSLAVAYKLGYVAVGDVAGLRAALRVEARGRRIIDVSIDSSDLRQLHAAISRAVKKAISEQQR
ncbi:2-succinyl-5-enolpyruvyl-6-hydroxy-3-cyclohexene-1-carboxylic-acid synthase [Paeniglutamicibacter cryotolerans]|uniref:2-succinyl-5-enolpyruvyl-6-hydroxy-3-cyclohexene-1-carboxylate synthase n=1 Tax=Paeniglutamicibacter cryotolerans TaxID=670079 RepID=A0A839QPT7_9MICC|nr:2-succinyl-5-enolpyruvyl-6-hydroxy-3-cyclohexene-1-carboxylic-acid synthase [Paeniglutamicibacter cryotolerans]MBB2994101.1 2-succinyl-5-enolpyruvyl-6-hydroxy-3-cyclohexene-1-carboxylate synthase [Paeniglutamicibacter cryotolerans]